MTVQRGDATLHVLASSSDIYAFARLAGARLATLRAGARLRTAFLGASSSTIHVGA